jgi:hypothetical protein
MIIRPHLEDKEKFMLVVNNYLGEKYNIAAIGQIGLKELKAKLKNEDKHKFSVMRLKHSRICSDSVLYALLRSSSAIEQSMEEQLARTKFEQLGFFMPDEVAQILLANNSELLLKSKFQAEYKMVEYCSQGGEKLVHAAQKVIDAGTFCNSKLKAKMQRYFKPKEFSEAPRVSPIELVSLLLGIGHTLGVVTLSNSTRFMMLMMNLVLILGHYQEMKQYVRRNLSHL